MWNNCIKLEKNHEYLTHKKKQINDTIIINAINQKQLNSKKIKII